MPSLKIDYFVGQRKKNFQIIEILQVGKSIRILATDGMGGERMFTARDWRRNNNVMVHGPEHDYKSERQCWSNIKKRCFNPKHPQFESYGGRGITMHPDWIDRFDLFIDHVGPKPAPQVSLDRINNDQGYVPGNLRWATPRQQNNNKRPPERVLASHCACGYPDTRGMLWHF